MARDLGIYTDADVSMRSHVTKTTSACFAVLRRLRGIRRSVPRRTVFQSPVSGATAAGLLQCSVGWHSTTPCTALAIGDERGRAACLRFIKVRPHLRQLHWLKVPWRIDYKLAVLVYKCLHGLAPSYLADELHHPAMFEIRKRLRSALSYELSIPRTRLSTYGDRAFHSCSRRCADLEQSSTAYHICSVTSRLLLSLEDTLLRTLLPVITVVVPAK